MEKVLSTIKGASTKMTILPLKEVCCRIVDCPHETPEWRENGVPVIRNYNLVDGHIDNGIQQIQILRDKEKCSAHYA